MLSELDSGRYSTNLACIMHLLYMYCVCMCDVPLIYTKKDHRSNQQLSVVVVGGRELRDDSGLILAPVLTNERAAVPYCETDSVVQLRLFPEHRILTYLHVHVDSHIHLASRM